eukprot:COSAG01_NODE_314_length_19013_cov_164.111240_2_plen_46_part_00
MRGHYLPPNSVKSAGASNSMHVDAAEPADGHSVASPTQEGLRTEA